MMKKTYISPAFIAVELRCNQMLAESTLGIKSGDIDSEGSVLVKEDNSPVTNKSVWDEEW